MNIQVGKWYIAEKNDKARPRWVLNANERGVIYATGGGTAPRVQAQDVYALGKEIRG